MSTKQKMSFKGKVAKNAEKSGSQGNSYGYLNMPKGVEMYEPVPGAREKIDILPYIITDPKHSDIDSELGISLGEYWYKRPFRIHRNVGAENDTVVCLSTFGKKCPICEYRKKRANEGAEKDELKAFNSSLRNLYIVIPRGIKKVEETIHLMDVSQFCFQDLLTEELSEKPDMEIFPSIYDGMTLQIRWAEEVFANNKFAKANRIDFHERDEALDEDLLDEIPELDKCLKQLSYVEMEAKFFEMENETEKEEKPVSKKSKKVDEDEDEEPEEEKAPVKERSKKPAEKKPKEPELTWDDLMDMDESELAEVIKSKDIDIDPDDYSSEKELRNAIAEELNIEKPAKKTAKSEPEKETPKRPERKKETSDDECPSGHKFGIDTDKFPKDCDDCKLWDKCIDKKESK
jgi:hypothetical protein